MANAVGSVLGREGFGVVLPTQVRGAIRRLVKSFFFAAMQHGLGGCAHLPRPRFTHSDASLAKPCAAAHVPRPRHQDPSMSYPTIKILPGEDRRLRGGSPWLFSNELRMDEAARGVPPGSLVRLMGPSGKM